MPTTTPLMQSIFDSDIRRVNFFNGRLLSGEDLSHEQDASRDNDRRLGRALGHGVASGLEVQLTPGADRATRPELSISPGVAVTRRGDVLVLADAVNLALNELPSSTPAKPPPITTFSACDAPTGGGYVAGDGVYVLTIGAVEGREGRAPVSGLGQGDQSCNSRYLVSGVRFRVIKIEPIPADLHPEQAPRLRNQLAYRCYAAEHGVQDEFWGALFGSQSHEAGLIDGLRPTLQNCEVPLALIHRTTSRGLEFVDMWAARRPVTQAAVDGYWSVLASMRRQRERSALFLQFRDQLEDMRSEVANLNAVRASDYFRYLPPVGIVPLADTRWPNGFNATNFFGGLTLTPHMVIEGSRLAHVVHASYDFPPIDLERDQKVALRLYVVRENQQGVDQNAITSPQPYLVFATGHMPPAYDAYFDLNRWSYSNFV